MDSTLPCGVAKKILCFVCLSLTIQRSLAPMEKLTDTKLPCSELSGILGRKLFLGIIHSAGFLPTPSMSQSHNSWCDFLANVGLGRSPHQRANDSTLLTLQLISLESIPNAL